MCSWLSSFSMFAEATKQCQAGQGVTESSKMTKEVQPEFLQVIASSDWRLLCLVPARLFGHTVKAGRRDSPGKPASCSQLGSHSHIRVFTVLVSFAQRPMLSMQTGTIWMIQNINQALFGLHNCSSSGNCQGICVCKERKGYSACNIGSGLVLGSTFYRPTSVVLDFMRVSSCH